MFSGVAKGDMDAGNWYLSPASGGLAPDPHRGSAPGPHFRPPHPSFVPLCSKFLATPLNMFNKYVMNDVKEYLTNFNLNKVAKNINCFVLVVPTSVIYKDKTSIKQISIESMYVPLFLPHPVHH